MVYFPIERFVKIIIIIIRTGTWSIKQKPFRYFELLKFNTRNQRENTKKFRGCEGQKITAGFQESRSSGKLLPHTTTCQHHTLACRCCWKIMASLSILPFSSHMFAFNWQNLSRDLGWQGQGKCSCQIFSLYT